MIPEPGIVSGTLGLTMSNDSGSRSGGFTLIELMAAMAIIGVVLLTSLAVFFERERRLRHAAETILVYQALANEAEVLRTIPFGGLSFLDGKPFLSNTSILGSLGGATTLLEVESPRPTLASIEASIVWRGGAKQATVTIIRSDTGGDNLW